MAEATLQRPQGPSRPNEAKSPRDPSSAGFTAVNGRELDTDSPNGLTSPLGPRERAGQSLNREYGLAGGLAAHRQVDTWARPLNQAYRQDQQALRPPPLQSSQAQSPTHPLDSQQTPRSTSQDSGSGKRKRADSAKQVAPQPRVSTPTYDRLQQQIQQQAPHQNQNRNQTETQTQIQNQNQSQNPNQNQHQLQQQYQQHMQQLHQQQQYGLSRTEAPSPHHQQSHARYYPLPSNAEPDTMDLDSANRSLSRHPQGSYDPNAGRRQWGASDEKASETPGTHSLVATPEDEQSPPYQDDTRQDDDANGTSTSHRLGTDDLMETSPHDESFMTASPAHSREDPNRAALRHRKRNFTNRTKTGCLTCRRRKKKCDEAQPECLNCIRGSFICQGYSQTASMSLNDPPQRRSSFGEVRANPMSPPHAHAAASRYPQSPYGVPAQSGARQYSEEETRERLRPSTSNTSLDHAQHHSSAWGPQPSPRNAQMTAAAAEQHALLAGGRDRDKMLSGVEFSHSAAELQDDRERCRAACWRFNQAANPTMGLSYQERMRMFADILSPHRSFQSTILPSRVGTQGANCVVEAPFTAEYGYNLQLGSDVFIGPGCTIMDGMMVAIGQRSYLGPNVQIYATSRPTQPERRQGYRGSSISRAITIGDDCYIAGGVIIRSGAHIGRGSTIEAGSVVEGTLPDYAVCAGNPARAIGSVNGDRVRGAIMS